MKIATGMQSRFLCVLFISTLILLFSIFMLLNLMLLKNEKNKYSMNAESRLNILAGQIDSNYNTVLNFSNNIVNSQIIIDILRDEQTDLEQVMYSYNLLEKFFKGFAEYEKNVANQFWIYPECSSFPEGAHVSKLEKLRERNVWERLEQAKDYETIWDYSEDGFISLFRKVSNYGTFLGILEVKIPMHYTENQLEDIQLIGKEQLIYLTSRGAEIYQCGAENRPKNGYQYTRDLVNGDQILLYADKHDVLGSYYLYTLFFVIMFVVVMCAIYFIYKYIVSKVTKELQDFINLLEEDDSVLADADFSGDGGDNDILWIKQRFKNLIIKNNRMHDDIERINKEKKKVEMEYLQMSFNPHLLYNSLSSIKWKLYASGEEQMSELIDQMTAYYRAVLSDGESVITIREEIDLIRCYLTIIEMSYNSKIQLTVAIEEGLSECYIIKQLLQPIVENAVMHGNNGMDNAQIRIGINKDGRDIVFRVENNGRAISEEAIQRALSGESGILPKRSYGIKNTINRIKTYYGEEYGLKIIGKPGIGTEVLIRIEYLDEDTLKQRM